VSARKRSASRPGAHSPTFPPRTWRSASGAVRDDVQRELLRRAYCSRFGGDEAIRPREFMAEGGWDEPTLQRALDELEGFLRLRDSGPSYVMTTAGVMEAERSGILHPACLALNERIRARIIALYGEQADREGKNASSYYEPIVTKIAAELGANVSAVLANHEFLTTVFDVEHPETLGWYRLSALGLARYRSWRQQTALLERFQELEPDPTGTRHGLPAPLRRARCRRRLDR